MSAAPPPDTRGSSNHGIGVMMDRNFPPSAVAADDQANGTYVEETFLPRARIYRNAVARLDRLQHRRRTIFPKSLFSDPAWDIVVELFKAHFSQQRMSIMILSRAAGVAPTTTLRWVNCLVDRNIAVRTHDPLDGRRVFVSLSATGVSLMELYCAELDEQPGKDRAQASSITTFSIGSALR
jgi:hypothetical protein